MRFIYAKFTGYIGFYNGIGKTELEIDFSKAKNRICVINGANGTGKSTLLNALNVMPDKNDDFVPGMNASKTLRLGDGINIYDIYITHPIDKNNNRMVSKASISKNGVELNPNGNISSYKDIIYNEFELDSNYITLTRLSGNDRGLADKKPAERKKFIASITDSLDTYNDIYKNLNKKSNILNSYLNNLSSKINNIGDENYLSTTKASITTRYNDIKSKIDSLSVKLVSDQTILKVNDPTMNVQQEWEDLNTSIRNENSLQEKYNSFFKDFHDKYPDIKKIDDSVIDECRSDIDKIKSIIGDYTGICVSAKNMSIQASNDIDRYNQKISGIYIDEKEEQLKDTIEKQEKELSEIKRFFKQYDIEDIDSISTSELDQIIKSLNGFIDTINSMYEQFSVSDLIDYSNLKLNSNEKSINYYINEKAEDTSMINSSLSNAEKELSQILSDKDTVSLLNNRPENCKINSCSFISASLEVLKKYNNDVSNIDNRIEEINKEIEDYKQKINENNKYVEKLSLYISIDVYLDRAMNMVMSNETLFSRFHKVIRKFDYTLVLKALRDISSFNDINDSISRFEDIKNNIIEYRSIIKVYNNLSSQYLIYKNKKDTIDQYKEEIDKCNKTKDEQDKIYYDYNNRIRDQNHFLDNKNIRLIDLIEANNKLSDYNKSKERLDKLNNDFDIVNERIKSSSDILKEVDDIKSKLMDLKSQLDPLEQQKTTIESQILMVRSFKEEYGSYKNKYDTIEILKKYSSPTKGGIQSLFMSMYMNKTLDLANQLLGMIFNGQYQLLDYVINENEFRIPFIGNGLPVDDISSGSTSQVCIMGMIINLVILNQASTKYNITSLDEIDGGLDHYNRMMFVDILQKLIQILNIDQLFIISHSVEAALNNVDLIQLSPINDYEDDFSSANIIYSYK